MMINLQAINISINTILKTMEYIKYGMELIVHLLHILTERIALK